MHKAGRKDFVYLNTRLFYVIRHIIVPKLTPNIAPPAG